MSESIDAKLQSLGLALPAVTPTRGSFKAYVISGNMLYLAGKGAPAREAADHVPKVGAEVSAAQAQAYAKEVALNQLAVIKDALGSLDRVKQVVKVFGMVNAVPDFSAHTEVINGFSDLMVQVFGARGEHARSAIGVGSLPRGFAVEIEAVIEFS
ncbi:MAG: endoribonuclease [Betaproteobacteria bacterium]|nr:endoribonuclease [Betaproteobacteria bacterium]